MAQVPMVVAVRRDERGDVTAVKQGIADTDTDTWVPGREPSVMPVIDLVDSLWKGDLVCTRMPNGTSGPKLRIVLAQGGHGVETVATDDPNRTVADFEQF